MPSQRRQVQSLDSVTEEEIPGGFDTENRFAARDVGRPGKSRLPLPRPSACTYIYKALTLSKYAAS